MQNWLNAHICDRMLRDTRLKTTPRMLATRNVRALAKLTAHRKKWLSYLQPFRFLWCLWS
jgi:hypothetical protein